MSPTIEDGDSAICSALPFYNPTLGDVVVVKSITDPGRMVVKRITGMPGSVVQARSGERYRLPQAYCWIEGDNAEVSRDSNE
eukprot:CAMPEP_0174265824 /NCGR_PEP_ID=MMETSP0439-20130205/28071_1 /TAXON_ID=0 /ORGANISM="Stereomyxa ramosa, Strain Chinc5" /LENGTH=81 /DNA_ID=CAMNT_0015352479 /DNA_START=1 /DNA_END=243 /DNA_ORIENTATION=+